MQPRAEPLFNVPQVVALLELSFAAVYAFEVLWLSPQQAAEFLWRFAFVPARYDTTVIVRGILPGGIGAEAWSFVTYAFLHADLTHLVVNCLWLLPFGSAVARRFGAVRFLAFFALTAVAGAAAHLVTHPGAFVPMIGASAAISGAMAGSMRFVFQIGGPLGLLRRNDREAYRVPAIALTEAFRNPRFLAFLGAWFAINLIFGFGSMPLAGAQQQVAWQAHMGGFIAGLLAFALFDPVPPHAEREPA